jgi:mannose-6-phosphate isomerase-like protein (cupin superfamily)
MLAAVKVVPPGGGEVVGDSPSRRVEILSDHDSLHTTWSRFGPGRDGADLHIHHRHTDLFYVLEGELTVRLGVEDELVAVPAGTLVRIPPGVVHGFRNASDAELRYLNLHAPGTGFADYMRGLSDFDQHDPPADGARPIAEAVIGPPADVPDDDVLAVAELTPPGERSPSPGVESIYVLEGELIVDGERSPAGTWAQSGAPLEVGGDGRYLSLRTPG